jgi:hypothetical protein
VRAVAFSPHGDLLAVGSNAPALHLCRTQQLRAALSIAAEAPLAVADSKQRFHRSVLVVCVCVCVCVFHRARCESIDRFT